MQVNEKRTDNKSKKSKTIIVAAIVLMLCLITTCVVGTTLAKYTTQGTGNDSAQVAKWGVKIEIQGDKLFSNEYKNPTDTEVTVKSTSDVVAPGTSGSTTFSISGTPEVKLHLDFALTDIKDVVLKTGNGKVDLDSDYYPIKFKLEMSGVTDAIAENKTLAEMKDVLDGLDRDYVVNSDLAATYTLSWVWDFDGNDSADTLLGDIIAGDTTGVTVDTYETEVSFKLTITATQID